MKQSKFFDKVLPNMSLNNVETVISCFSSHLSVYVGQLGRTQQSAQISWANQNGFMLDLWTDDSDTEGTLYDRPSWRYGMQSEILGRYFGIDTGQLGIEETNALFDRIMGFAKTRAAKLKGGE